MELFLIGICVSKTLIDLRSFTVQQICDLSSDLNVIVRLTDAAASDRNKTVICIIYLAYQFTHFPYIFMLTVDLCADATPS